MMMLRVLILFILAFPVHAQGFSEVLRQMMIEEVREKGDKGNDYAKMEKDCEGRICTYREKPIRGRVEYQTEYGEWVVNYPVPYYATASSD